jgi:poly(A) polymerase
MKSTPSSIIPRDQHPISRSMLSPNAVKVLYRLKDSGFTAYLVGGCVRDLLLGREPKDFDIVTDATPSQIKRLFRNCRLVGRRFRLAHLHYSDEIIEVATFRSSAPETAEPVVDADGSPADQPHHAQHMQDEDGMVLRDNVFGTPEEDALRRDFTINALSYTIADFSIIDTVGGMADLQRGVIRTIGEPSVRFTEDPVRMLRAVRFAAMLGFEIEPATWQAILQLAPTVNRAAPARLYEEVLKLFLQGEAARTCQMLRQSGMFAALFPAFDRWLETESEGFPHTGLGKALSWADDRFREGGPVSPPLLFALMFGQYLGERAESLEGDGLPPQQAMNAAIAEHFSALAATVLVPQRICTAISTILTSQSRFGKTPGKRPLSFTGRPGFADAFNYFRFSCSFAGKGTGLIAWWEKFLRDNPAQPPAPADKQGDTGRPPRKRRRRRGGRSKTAQPT